MTSPVQRSVLAAQLTALGVRNGGVLMVHTSLRKLGPIEGRALGLVDALLDVVGPHGTLLVVLSAQENVPFDASRTPAHPDMGAFAEVFRNLPAVRLNDHPADRFGALGPRAAELIDDSPLNDYHGPGSVLERLVAAGGQVLRLGADMETTTFPRCSSISWLQARRAPALWVGPCGSVSGRASVREELRRFRRRVDESRACLTLPKAHAVRWFTYGATSGSLAFERGRQIHATPVDRAQSDPMLNRR